MPDKNTQYLLSDPDALRRIKFAQFRAQLPALILVAVAIALKNIFPQAGNWLFNLSLALAILAIAVYFFVGLCYRYRQRISLPPPDALLSPVEGQIDRVRSSGDTTLLTVRKKLFDGVELRSPHSASRLEDGVLFLESEAGRISFRFNFRHIQWFVDPDMTAGNLIGYVAGTGSCTVVFPGKPRLDVKEKDPLYAASSILDKIEVKPGPAPLPESALDQSQKETLHDSL